MKKTFDQDEIESNGGKEYLGLIVYGGTETEWNRLVNTYNLTQSYPQDWSKFHILFNAGWTLDAYGNVKYVPYDFSKFYPVFNAQEGYDPASDDDLQLPGSGVVYMDGTFRCFDSAGRMVRDMTVLNNGKIYECYRITDVNEDGYDPNKIYGNFYPSLYASAGLYYFNEDGKGTLICDFGTAADPAASQLDPSVITDGIYSHPDDASVKFMVRDHTLVKGSGSVVTVSGLILNEGSIYHAGRSGKLTVGYTESKITENGKEITYGWYFDPATGRLLWYSKNADDVTLYYKPHAGAADVITALSGSDADLLNGEYPDEEGQTVIFTGGKAAGLAAIRLFGAATMEAAGLIDVSSALEASRVDLVIPEGSTETGYILKLITEPASPLPEPGIEWSVVTNAPKVSGKQVLALEPDAGDEHIAKITASCTGRSRVRVTVKSKDSAGNLIETYTAECLFVITDTNIYPDGLTITSASGNGYVKPGETLTLNAAFTPADANANTSITWKSSNLRIAAVSPDPGDPAKAVVKGMAPGSAVIQARCGNNIRASFEVTCDPDGHVDPPAPVIVPKKVIVKAPYGTEVYTGETLSLAATVSPDGAPQDLTWSSSAPAVATVDLSGVVTGCSNGTVTITAASKDYPNVKGSIKLTVLTKVTSVDINGPADGKVMTGKTVMLTAEFNEGASDKGLVWQTDDPAIADVDQNGKVTGKAAGTALITAVSTADSSKSDDYEIKVYEPVSGLKFNTGKISLGKGESRSDVKVMITPATATDADIKYESSDETVVMIKEDGSGNPVLDENGCITLIAGMFTDKTSKNANITATAMDGSGRSAKCTVTVGNAVDLLSLSAPKDQDTLAAGKTLKFTPVFNGGDKTKQPANKDVTWSIVSVEDMDGHAIADEDEWPYYATIDEKGTLKGVAACTVKIKAVHDTSGTESAGYPVRIFVPMSKFVISDSKLTISENKPGGYELGAEITPADATFYDTTDGTALVQDKLKWEVVKSDKAAGEIADIVSVDPETGRIAVGTLPATKTKATATIKVTAKSDGDNGKQIEKYATCTVTVVKEVKVTKLTLDTPKITAGVGTEYVVNVKAEPATADDKEITWECNVSDSVVDVSEEDGKYKIKVLGVPDNKNKQAEIVFKNIAGGKSVKCNVIVGNPVSGVEILPLKDEQKKLAVGKSLGLKANVVCAASATDSKAKPANRTVTWKITEAMDANGEPLAEDKFSRIATVDSKGNVKALGCGTVKVTAVSNETPASGSAEQDSVYIVTCIPVKGLTISAAKRSVGEGNTGELWISAVTPDDVFDPSDGGKVMIDWMVSDPENPDDPAVKIAALADGAEAGSLTDTDFSATAQTSAAEGQKLIFKATGTGKKAIMITGTAKDGSGKSVKCSVTVIGRMKEEDVKIKITFNSAKALKDIITVTAKDSDTDPGTSPGYDIDAKLLEVTDLPVKKTITLTPVVTAAAANKTVTYVSSDPRVATVNNKGVVTAKGAGSATITMMTADGGFTATCTVSVTP
ncbi:MAG: Ig-like domain-containing protein [Lachnospiraceae bacterium]|nr:Ig-like domain-containing protein [Lachnospiraceae bacterium]